jgi:hypothetical protein
MEYQHSSKTIHNEILDLAGDEENHSFILMTLNQKKTRYIMTGRSKC